MSNNSYDFPVAFTCSSSVQKNKPRSRSPGALKLPLDNIVHHAAAVHLRAVEMHERLEAPLLVADRGIRLAIHHRGACLDAMVFAQVDLVDIDLFLLWR